MTTQYEQLRKYCDDLTERVMLRDAWRLRHPDHDTQKFREEMRLWADEEIMQDESGVWHVNKDFLSYGMGPIQLESSFDPNDQEPNTRDILTVDTFLNLMTIALSAYERLANEGK
jgi:hypothetical protein